MDLRESRKSEPVLTAPGPVFWKAHLPGGRGSARRGRSPRSRFRRRRGGPPGTEFALTRGRVQARRLPARTERAIDTARRPMSSRQPCPPFPDDVVDRHPSLCQSCRLRGLIKFCRQTPPRSRQSLALCRVDAPSRRRSRRQRHFQPWNLYEHLVPRGGLHEVLSRQGMLRRE